MTLPGLPTPQDQLDYYYLVRNIIWRYRLDDAEEAVIKRLATLLEEMRREVSGAILRYRPEQYTRQRLAQLLQEIELYSAATKAAAGSVIAEASGVALEQSIIEQAHILSVGGRAAAVRGVGVGMGGVEFGALMATTPLGGRALQGWVDAAFAEGQEAILNAIQTGLFQGEGYRKIVKRVLAEAEEMTLREAVTLTRTYVQTASVAAQEAVFQNNKDVIGWLEWSAIMEPSYKQTGRGTCLICAGLDGQRYRPEEEKPPMPRHPRCRCCWIPRIDWKRLGIPELEITEAVRPYTIRDNLNIDAGGRREILESGMHKGNWASWAAKRDSGFKMQALGPRRYALWRESGMSFQEFAKHLVDKKTGELLTVQELEKAI